MNDNNTCYMVGTIQALPITDSGTSYYFPIQIQRPNGLYDVLQVYFSQDSYLENMPFLLPEQKIAIWGEIQSRSILLNGISRFIVCVWANRLLRMPKSRDDRNDVFLRGMICKPPQKRETYSGKPITNMFMQIKHDGYYSIFVPCLCWGAYAENCARLIEGDRLDLMGRLQSREYKKTLLSGEVEDRMQYNVSVASFKRIL